MNDERERSVVGTRSPSSSRCLLHSWWSGRLT